jgi:hypothetical protein
VIKKAKDLRVGDVIYFPKYNAAAVVAKVTKHCLKSGLTIYFTKTVYSAVGEPFSFNWRHFEGKVSIPVIGQAKIN